MFSLATLQSLLISMISASGEMDVKESQGAPQPSDNNFAEQGGKKKKAGTLPSIRYIHDVGPYTPPPMNRKSAFKSIHESAINLDSMGRQYKIVHDLVDLDSSKNNRKFCGKPRKAMKFRFIHEVESSTPPPREPKGLVDRGPAIPLDSRGRPYILFDPGSSEDHKNLSDRNSIPSAILPPWNKKEIPMKAEPKDEKETTELARNIPKENLPNRCEFFPKPVAVDCGDNLRSGISQLQ